MQLLKITSSCKHEMKWSFSYKDAKTRFHPKNIYGFWKVIYPLQSYHLFYVPLTIWCRLFLFLLYFGVTSVRGTRYPVEWYPDPWHVYPDVRLRPWDVPELNNLLPSLRVGETVLVRITSPPYVDSCKISLWDNFRGHIPHPKGVYYAQLN